MDSLSFSGAGMRRITSSSFPVPVSLDSRAPPSHVSASRCRSSVTGASVSAEPAPDPALSRSLPRPFRPRRPAADERNDDIDPEEEGEGTEMPRLKKKRGNWVLKIMLIGSIWSVKKKSGNEDLDEKGERENQEEVGKDRIGCSCLGEEETESFGVEDGVVFERDSFSRFLRRVSLVEARLYAKMSYLGKLAYFINNIKPGNLLKCHGLHFVTSSLEKKVQALNKEKENDLQSRNVETEYNPSQVQDTHETLEIRRQKKFGSRISASYRIAAAAASYVQSQTRSIFPFKSTKMTAEKDFTQESNTGTTEEKSVIPSSELASFVATTNSVTAMVAAKEETKEAVAKDLNSTKSSPCEWFICDDETGGTRFFVIQGSDSVASWQANLLFEPIQFEGLDVLVHRGIYEAAKGIYRQLLPEVKAHLKSRGKYATLRFTGHSLGGSLALLVNLMLLIRGEAPLTSLLPVITFGSPSIMCGGDRLLRKLGLPQTHVQAITMHRDVVPRAFSCNYPDHVAELLKAVNGNFRNHPCLNKKKMLYAPMGELLILQPDEKLSPGHHLLPSGSGLYLLRGPESNSNDSLSQLQAAQTTFLNSPHPLEILSDPSAYGSDGAICRDHDMNSYLRAIRNVIRQDLNCIRKAKREQRRKLWWPLVAPQEILHTGILIRPQLESGDVGQHHQLTISSFLRTGLE